MEKKEYANKILVKMQLPQQDVKSAIDEETQTKYEFLNFEEALTEIIERLQKLEKIIKA